MGVTVTGHDAMPLGFLFCVSGLDWMYIMAFALAFFSDTWCS